MSDCIWGFYVATKKSIAIQRQNNNKKVLTMKNIETSLNEASFVGIFSDEFSKFVAKSSIQSPTNDSTNNKKLLYNSSSRVPSSRMVF